MRAATSPRTVLLVIGILGIQLGFIGSYVGAFHNPVPHKVPLALVAPTAMASGAAADLDRLRGQPLQVEVVASVAQAKHLIAAEAVDGALVLGPRTDRLLVASADGGALSDAVTDVAEAFTAGAHQQLVVTDVVPANAKDARGLSAFYLVVGWGIGGYLLASLLAVSIGPRPRDRRSALARLGVLAVYSALSGAGGALVVGSVDALPGHFAALAALGALVVFAVGAFSMALEAFAGVLGIGLVIIVLVVLGNPSAGGAYPTPLLPAFWRTIGQWLPPGAGTTAVRAIAYFPAAGLLHQLLTLAVYGAMGIAGTLAASRPRARHGRRSAPQTAPRSRQLAHLVGAGHRTRDAREPERAP
jgi:hypothetical protein